MRLLSAAALALLCVASFGYALTPVGNAATVATVSMHEFKFCDGTDSACNTQPAVTTIGIGDRVTWVWAESATDPAPNCDTVLLQPPFPVTCPGHTATAVDKDSAGKPLFDSGTCAAPDGKPRCPFSVTFNKAGTYQYYCVFHGGSAPNNPATHMDGVVVVRAAASSAPGGGAPASKPEAPAVTVLPNTSVSPPLPLLGLGALVVGAGLLGGRGILRRRR